MSADFAHLAVWVLIGPVPRLLRHQVGQHLSDRPCHLRCDSGRIHHRLRRLWPSNSLQIRHLNRSSVSHTQLRTRGQHCQAPAALTGVLQALPLLASELSSKTMAHSSSEITRPAGRLSQASAPSLLREDLGLVILLNARLYPAKCPKGKVVSARTDPLPLSAAVE